MASFHEFNDWKRIEDDWCAWWAGELDRPLVLIETLEPGLSWDNFDTFITRFPLDMPADQVLDQFEPYLNATRYFGDAYPRWWPNFGAGIVAAFLGARVEHSTGTTWFHPLDVASLRDIHLSYDPTNVWWQRVQDITQAAIARWGGHATICYTDLGGNLDILASLRGTQELLYDLYDAPDEVERLVHEITQLWLYYYNALDAMIQPVGRGTAAWAPHWQPGRGYMLQSDFSFMISPDMFERLVKPDLTACCAEMDYGFYHMDGKGQIPHLDHLLSVPRLRGIQWQPGAGAPQGSEWIDLLRRIREGGKLCQVYVSPEGAMKIKRELDGGRGFLLAVGFEDDKLTPQQAVEFLDEFYA